MRQYQRCRVRPRMPHPTSLVRICNRTTAKTQFDIQITAGAEHCPTHHLVPVFWCHYLEHSHNRPTERIEVGPSGYCVILHLFARNQGLTQLAEKALTIMWPEKI